MAWYTDLFCRVSFRGKTYNDIHKDDNFVDTERKERYDVHMARLKVAQALRARTAGEDVSVEDAMQDYMNMK